MEEILQRINEIFIDAFDKEDLVITKNTTADDIEGWDSLMQVNLIEMIEDEFDIQFGMDEIAGMKSVGAMVDMVAAKI